MRVSVVVPTRNRNAQLPACLESILRADPFEIVVVDQSDVATPHLPDDPRIRWLRCPPRGVCVGRNVGIEHSTGEIVANTDDDCIVPPDWIARIRELFESDPEAAVVCGRVHLPEGAVGFGATFEPREREHRGRFPPVGDLGITANLAVRRSTFEKVGNFDSLMGAGGKLRSGGEPEFLLRVLGAGLKVVGAREIDVLHLGVRPWGKESSQLLRQYAFGSGAALMKQVRVGGPGSLRFFLASLGRLLRWNALVFRGTWPAGFSSTIWFLYGALASLRQRVDPKTRMYVSPPLPACEVPSLSVVVATCDRPGEALACVRSILKNPEMFELLVVDQGTDGETRSRLASIGDQRLRLVRSEKRGVTQGRSVGIEETRGEAIAFTDDGCSVAPDWIRTLLDRFTVDPTLAAICGKVADDKGQPARAGEWGGSTNLAVRRSALAEVIAGGPLPEPAELLCRLRSSGHQVVNAPEVLVTEPGLRPRRESAATSQA